MNGQSTSCQKTAVRLVDVKPFVRPGGVVTPVRPTGVVTPVRPGGVLPARPTDVIPPVSSLQITLCNVVTSLRTRCHLNLRRIAMESKDVIYRKESQVCFFAI